MVVGSYTGNGAAGRAITGTGFSPDIVYVISSSTGEVIQKSSATASAFNFYDGPPDATWITSLDADGFTIGTDARVNTNGTLYHYVAWNEAPGYLEVGTYTGNGAASQDITTVGFEPEYLFVRKNEQFFQAHQRPASLAASNVDATLMYYNFGLAGNRITALLSNGFRVGSQTNVNENLDTFIYHAWKRQTGAAILTGYYTGTGAALLIDDLGFDPDFVMVKQSTGATNRIGVARVDTAMANGKQMTGATALTGQTITGFVAGGFSVGTSNLANASGVDYHFTAFQAGASSMKVGRYQGNGTSTAITNMGFSPELVFIFPEGAQTPVHYSSGNTAEFYDFDAGAGTAAAGVIALGADGFTVTTANASVNQNTIWYNYVAWNQIPGEMKVGSYLADGTAKNITGLGFEPEYVIVKHFNNFHTVQHPASLGRSVDQTLYFNTLPASPNTTPADLIEALVPDGFTIGFDFQVNQSGANYAYYAWKRPDSTLTAVRLTSFIATRYEGGVLLNWKTGYEIDNLGFHVYREVNGERTRVTRSMIAGSGLMAGQGTAVNAEQTYATWDRDPAAADPSAVYYLEDLDLNGTKTMNGPVTPVDGGLQAPPVTVTSTSMRELGHRSKRRGRINEERGARLERRHNADRSAKVVRPASELETQRALAAQPAVKIGVNHPGWYRVTQAELVGAGLDRRLDPRTLRLFVDGVEQAISVTGDEDGRFDAADVIEFYATGVDTPYADTRTYWLTSGGRQGKRAAVQIRPALRAQAVTRGGFDFTLQQKERSIYFAALRNGDAENWFGALVSEEPADLSFELPNVATLGASAELEVTLQGVTDSSASALDHLVAVQVNGAEVGRLEFDGQALGTQSFPLPAGLLHEGANTVTLVAEGGEQDISLVDVVRLRYAHAYRADADLLRFSAEAGGTITVGGFASKAIRVVDITDPLAAEELRGVVGSDDSLSAITVRLSGAGARTLLAFTDATAASPLFVRANQPSTWYSASNSADYLVVSHADFADTVAPLIARRIKSGLSVARIDIEDVYDEFSFGEKTPYALKDFIKRARDAWRKKPQFLLLVGDATLDPRDYDGQGDADFVPTKQVPMAQVALETASDDWFADADDDGLPEVAVGRLPVRTQEQAETMVTKILEYEDGDGTGWTRRVLLVSGHNDEPTSDFEQSNTSLQRLIPSEYTVRHVVSDGTEGDTARVQILDAVNEGQSIVNYIGHGSVRVWGREALLTSDDVSHSWLNAGRLPLVVAMNCLNGFFHGIYDEESLAETLLRTPGAGAVATWASSGVTESSMHTRVNQELFRLLFSDPTLTIGQAAALAKRVVPDRDVRRTWIFFGDPALRLKGVPQLPAPTSTTAKPPAATLVMVPPTVSNKAASMPDARVPRVAPFRLADWNGDGRADLFVHAATGWQAILTSRTGNRVTAGRWTTNWEVYPADLNGDGIGDMVLLDRTSGRLVQALHDGKGNFDSTESALVVGPLADVHVADLNGDHLDDLLLTSAQFGSWQTGLNDGHGHFTYRAGSWLVASSITVADFNGDRRADAFLYDAATGFWTLAFSNRAGDFTSTSGQWTPGWTVQRADLDGDARADLLLYSGETGAWAECVTQDAGQFAVRRGAWAAGLTVIPLESQGRRDDILLYRPASGEWSLVMQPSGATVVAGGTWLPALSITTGDLDGDGRGDLFLYKPDTGAWMTGLRRDRGPFEFGTGEMTPRWHVATRP
jgi:hypothetical protein